MKQIDLREGARRQHRAIAMFAVLQCWMRALDGIVFDRPHLERLLGLERFKGERVDWIKEDFQELFPFLKVYYFTKKRNSLGSLYLSRQSLKGVLEEGEMSDKERLRRLPENGPRLDMFQMWRRPNELRAGFDSDEDFETLIPFFADFANYDERFLASYLSLLTQGQISPKTFPGLNPELRKGK